MRRFLFLISLLWMMTSAAFAGVNVNTASQSELETLPGIGPSKAAAIMEYRSSNGPFTNVEQLDNVPGIGPATMSNLRTLVELGEESTDGAPQIAAPAGETTAPAMTTTPTGGDRVNINTASQNQLEDLPGIGPSKASAILQYRTDVGPFSSCAALDAVSGIGPATVSALSDRCAVE
ncbi:MAG: competence protein ComEA [Myxococcota bacterium]|jgi:competence protein ComEA